MKSNTKVTTKELLSHAFDMMKLLKAKAISVEEAKAQANLLKQSNNIIRYELDRAIALQKFDGIEIRDIEDLETNG
jgi:hypothetical protein